MRFLNSVFFFINNSLALAISMLALLSLSSLLLFHLHPDREKHKKRWKQAREERPFGVCEYEREMRRKEQGLYFTSFNFHFLPSLLQLSVPLFSITIILRCVYFIPYSHSFIAISGCLWHSCSWL